MRIIHTCVPWYVIGSYKLPVAWLCINYTGRRNSEFTKQIYVSDPPGTQLMTWAWWWKTSFRPHPPRGKRRCGIVKNNYFFMLRRNSWNEGLWINLFYCRVMIWSWIQACTRGLSGHVIFLILTFCLCSVFAGFLFLSIFIYVVCIDSLLVKLIALLSLMLRDVSNKFLHLLAKFINNNVAT